MTLYASVYWPKSHLAYNEKNDYVEWKQKVKEKYIELLGLDSIAQNACDIKVKIEERVETDEYVALLLADNFDKIIGIALQNLQSY